MTVTVGTHKLISHLTDALATGGGVVDGIHLATTRGEWRDEPGKRDLLVATSTNRWTIGHTWIPCDGTMVSMVWPYGSTRTLLGVLKVLSKKGENHCVDIDMVRAEPKPNAKTDEHPGWIVTVSETKALFDSDTRHEFHAHPENRFPIDWAMRVLSGNFEHPDEYTEVPVTLWGSDALKRLASIAARRGMDIQLFRSSSRLIQMAQIGPTWLGAASPVPPTPGQSIDGPSEEPVLPWDPSLVTGIVRHGKGLFSTVRKEKGDPDPADEPADEPLPEDPEEDPEEYFGADPASSSDDAAEVDDEPAEADSGEPDAGDEPTADGDAQLRQAIELVVSTRIGSPSMLQRKLKITYARANALLDTMTGHGITGPAVGSAARDVFSVTIGDALKLAGL